MGILLTDVSALEPTEGERQGPTQPSPGGKAKVAAGQVALVPLVGLQVAQVAR